KDKKQTEFAIAAIPLGGYVKMLDERIEAVDKSRQHLAFNNKSKLQRAMIISAGPLANLLFAFCMYWIVFMLGVPSYPAMVERIEANGFIPAEKITAGAELKSISGIKVN